MTSISVVIEFFEEKYLVMPDLVSSIPNKLPWGFNTLLVYTAEALESLRKGPVWPQAVKSLSASALKYSRWIQLVMHGLAAPRPPTSICWAPMSGTLLPTHQTYFFQSINNPLSNPRSPSTCAISLYKQYIKNVAHLHNTAYIHSSSKCYDRP